MPSASVPSSARSACAIVRTARSPASAQKARACGVAQAPGVGVVDLGAPAPRQPARLAQDLTLTTLPADAFDEDALASVVADVQDAVLAGVSVQGVRAGRAVPPAWMGGHRAQRVVDPPPPVRGAHWQTSTVGALRDPNTSQQPQEQKSRRGPRRPLRTVMNPPPSARSESALIQVWHPSRSQCLQVMTPAARLPCGSDPTSRGSGCSGYTRDRRRTYRTTARHLGSNRGRGRSATRSLRESLA